MKRFISLITALTLLLTLILCNVPTSFAAKEQLEFVLTNAAALNNEEFTIELQLKNNPGVYAFWFMIYYDADTFILRDYKLTDEFAALGELTTTEPNRDAEYYKDGVVSGRVVESFPSYGVDPENKNMMMLMYENESYLENCELNGTAITLTFQAMGIAEAGNHTIGLVPDAESFINVEEEEVPFKMTNAIVTVGSTVVPEETAPSQEHNDTVKVEPEETTTASDIIVLDPEDTTAAPVVTQPEETFEGDDGKIYYENEDGETVEYKEEDFTTPADKETDPGTGGADISPEGEENTSSKEEEKKNNTVLYIVIAAVLVLLGVAGILIVFISKTKKNENGEEPENKDNQ